MSAARYDFIRTQLLQMLSDEDRQIFLTHQQYEDELAERAESEEEFYRLLVNESPVKRTATELFMGVDEVFTRVQTIDLQLHEMTEKHMASKFIQEVHCDSLSDRNPKNSYRTFFMHLPVFPMKNNYE